MSRKPPPPSSLASTMRRAMNGERVVDPDLAALSESNNSLTGP